jgi:protein-disulfide isomerase
MDSKTMFVTGLLAVGVIGAGLIVFSAMRSGSSTVDSAARTVQYTFQGQTMTANLTPTKADPLEGARFISGSKDAPVTIVEFADYQCPACSVFANDIEGSFQSTLVEGGKVRYAYRDYPLPNHANAMQAARAAACANDQGKFQAMHQILYRGQSQWSNSSSDQVLLQFKDYAGQTGLDVGQFDSCQRSSQHDQDILSDRDAGNRVGLEATPTFVINGFRVAGILPVEGFQAIINQVTGK